MIRFGNVSLEKDGHSILRNISVHIRERRVGIIGRNGSGKSSFARLFNGLERPTAGTVTLEGAAGPAEFRKSVGFVFQNPDNQIVYPIVSEDLAFGLKNLKLGVEEIQARTEAVLARFGLGHLRDRFTHRLSGGEKQMLALAGVLVMRPRMIVLDEPTTLLDLWNRQRFMTALSALEEHVVMVSHDLALLQDFDRVLHIHDGQIVDDGAPHSVIDGYIRQSQC